MGIIAEQDLNIRATELPVGERVVCTSEYRPDDGTTGFNVGWNSALVRSDGSVRFVADYTELTGQDLNLHRPGTLTIAVYDAATPAGSAPALETVTLRVL